MAVCHRIKLILILRAITVRRAWYHGTYMVNVQVKFFEILPSSPISDHPTVHTFLHRSHMFEQQLFFISCRAWVSAINQTNFPPSRDMFPIPQGYARAFQS